MLRPISMPVKTRCRFTDYRKSVDSTILTIAVSSQNLKNGESYDGLIRCMARETRGFSDAGIALAPRGTRATRNAV